MRWFRKLNKNIRNFLTALIWLVFLIYNSMFAADFISIVLLCIATAFGIEFVIIADKEDRIWRKITQERKKLEQEQQEDDLD